MGSREELLGDFLASQDKLHAANARIKVLEDALRGCVAWMDEIADTVDAEYPALAERYYTETIRARRALAGKGE